MRQAQESHADRRQLLANKNLERATILAAKEASSSSVHFPGEESAALLESAASGNLKRNAGDTAALGSESGTHPRALEVPQMSRLGAEMLGTILRRSHSPKLPSVPSFGEPSQYELGLPPMEPDAYSEASSPANSTRRGAAQSRSGSPPKKPAWLTALRSHAL